MRYCYRPVQMVAPGGAVETRAFEATRRTEPSLSSMSPIAMSGFASRIIHIAITRSSSRLTSISLNWSVTSISEMIAPARGKMRSVPSRASRCMASRTGVRPNPSRRLIEFSEMRLPGASSNVTIISSRRRYAWLAWVSSGVCTLFMVDTAHIELRDTDLLNLVPHH